MTTPEPWLIHFFRRHRSEDSARTTPAVDFFESIPEEVAAQIQAVLDAVAAAPPPSFSGGGKWEAMHGDMAGFYEVRVQFSQANYRLFCVLERDAEGLGGSSIVCIDGLVKPRRSAAKARDYRRAVSYRREFEKRRTVL